MAAGKSTRRRRDRTASSPPDFDLILGAFADAQALLSVSYQAVSANVHSGPESVVMRLGVDALDRAYDRLDKAISQLSDAEGAS